MRFKGRKILTSLNEKKIYRVIHKSLRDFRPMLYSGRDGHAEWEHINRGRDTPSFCPNLQVLDMTTLGDAADVNPVIKFLPSTLQHLAVESSDCLHDPSSQLWQITLHGGHVCTRPLCHVIYRVWQELDYRFDICRVTKVGHI
jgi:hypothetical protein